MRGKSLMFLFGILAIAILLTSCPMPSNDEGTDLDPDASRQLTAEGIALMKEGDWDGALSKFSQAVLKDPANGTAIVGYSALNIADIIADPDVVSLAREKLGIEDYPSSMRMVLDPDSWMIRVDLDEISSLLMPHITNEDAYDGKARGSSAGDGIDPNERMLAFAGFFMTHNPTGFTHAVETVTNTLGRRLDAAVNAIKTAPDDTTFTLTWDMFFEIEPTEGSGQWPFKNGEPMDITFGKAELLAIAASIEAVRGLTYLAQVYSLSLPLGDYWAAFNPADGTLINPPSSSKPFVTFLRLNTDAAQKLASAKTSYTSAIADLTTAIDQVAGNRPGFFLSTDPAAGMFTDFTEFEEFTDILLIARKFATEVDGSIETKGPAYLPIDFPSDFDPDTDWPTSIVQGSSISINFGVFFDTPLNLHSVLIDLESNGEPAYQRLDSGDFQLVTQGYMDSFLNDFDGNQSFFYLRLPDITLGGIIPLSNYTENVPFDDPSTRYTFNLNWDDNLTSTGKWTWIDNNPANGVYDHGEGEPITYAEFSPDTEGPLKFPLDAYGSDPEGYYSTEGDVPAALLNPYLENQTDAYRAALRAALVDAGNLSRNQAMLTFLKDKSMYIGCVPVYLAWHSFTTAGTPGTDPWDVAMTSKGSIWWVGAAQLHDLLAP